MIAKFVRGVDILKLTRYGGENQVQCSFLEWGSVPFVLSVHAIDREKERLVKVLSYFYFYNMKEMEEEKRNISIMDARPVRIFD